MPRVRCVDRPRRLGNLGQVVANAGLLAGTPVNLKAAADCIDQPGVLQIPDRRYRSRIARSSKLRCLSDQPARCISTSSATI